MQIVARLTELRDGGLTRVKLGETEMVLLREGGEVRAFAADCPHAGAPLEQGAVCDGRLICPWHKSSFRIADGGLLEPPALDALARYPVRIEGTDVLASAEPVPAPPPVRRNHARTMLLLGSGAAGTAAAAALREFGFSGRVVLVGHEAPEPYDRTALSKFVLSGEMPPAEVPPLRPPGFWAAHDIERIEAGISRVAAGERRVQLADGRVLEYEAALLATGAVARRPELPGATLEGVRTLRDRMDAAAIIAAAPPGARVVIVGSSFIGLEAASALRKHGVRVSVVGPEEIPFERQFGPEIGRIFRRLHVENGVEMALGAKPARIEGTERAEAVVLDDGRRLPAELVLLGVGVRPATGFVDGVTHAEDGGIVVDAGMRAADGLYVAGDCASFPFQGGRVRIEHWRLAQQHARVAARNMAGQSAQYDDVPFFWTYHYGNRFEYLGHAEHWDSLHIDGDLDSQQFVALQAVGERVMGVIACQRERVTGVLLHRMRTGLTVEQARSVLREDD